MDNNFEISKKTKITMILITLLIFLVSLAGITYAYFGINIQGNQEASQIHLDTANLSLEYTDLQLMMKTSAFPGWSDTKTITVENTGNDTVYYNIAWRELKSNLLNGDLVISATCASNIGTCDNLPERMVPASTAELTNVYMYGPIDIDSEEVHTYTVTVQYKERGKNQRYNKNASFYGTLNIADGTPTKASLFEYTTSNNQVTITGYNFGSVTYTVSNASKCEEYLDDEIGPDDSDVLCAGGTNSQNETLDDFILSGDIDSNNYTNAGLTDVVFHYTSQDVIIPSTIDNKPVVAIASNAFEKNHLNSVVIPNTVTTIGNFAFSYNNLVTVVIPPLVTSLGTLAFAFNDLTSIEIPSGITSIPSSAFYDNNILSVAFDGNITSIGNSAFSAASSASSNRIAYIDIPATVTTINAYAFRWNNLYSLYIPSNVTLIESYAFEWANIHELTLSEGLQRIGSYSFYGNHITDVTIPSTVTRIENYAFNGANSSEKNLESVTIKTKTSSSGFTTYGTNIWGWSSSVTCTTNNTSNITNGCITWGA